MSGEVQFEDENKVNYGVSLQNFRAEPLSFLEDLVVKTGIVKSRVRAQYVLMGLVIIFFLLAVVIFVNSGIVRIGDSGVSKDKMIKDAQNARNKFNTNF